MIMDSTNLNAEYSIIGKLPLVIASDHAGLELKLILIEELTKHGIELLDVGSYEGEKVDYPDYAKHLTDAIGNGKSKYGILVCGTGVGMSIAANREKFIRAVLCNTEELAITSRRGNDANVLVLGARNTSEKKAVLIMKKFFSTEFIGKESQVRRIKKIS